MVDIIVHYSGVFAQPTIDINGDGDHCQVLISEGNSMEAKVVFTGSKFSNKEFLKRVAQEKKKR